MVTPQMASSWRATSAGNAVEPVTPYLRSDVSFSPCGGVLHNCASVVGTPDRIVIPNFSTNFQ